MDHLEIGARRYHGLFAGSRMTAWLAQSQPQRLRSAVLGGIGIGLIEGGAPAKRPPQR